MLNILIEILLAIILGIVQGISEFLPISSTAHLRIISAIVANNQQADIGLVVSNIIQFGTLIAILQYFWKDLSQYLDRIKYIIQKPSELKVLEENIKIWWHLPSSEDINKKPHLNAELQKLEKDEKFLVDSTLAQLFVGTIPIVVLGSLARSFANVNRDLSNIAWFLILGSCLFVFAETMHLKAKSFQKLHFITKSEVLLVGLFQVLAAFPGISRSGATLSGALLLGRDRNQSVRLSFLLSIPALFMLSLLDFIKLILEIRSRGINILPQGLYIEPKTLQIHLSLTSIILAFAIAYFVGRLVLRWLLGYLGQKTLRNFVMYRIALAFLLLFWIFVNKNGTFGL